MVDAYKCADSRQPDRSGALLDALARASTPAERLTQPWLTTTNPDLGRQRFVAWTGTVAGGRLERAAATLVMRGLDLRQWQDALGDVAVVPGQPHPDWVTATFELLNLTDVQGAGPIPTLGEIAGSGLPTWMDPEQPWKFHSAFVGWMSTAEAMIDDWCQAAGADLGPSARRDLLLWLTRRLLALAAQTLIRHGPPKVPARQWWAAIWIEQPVLARLMARTYLQWQDACAELVGRIGTDIPSICGSRGSPRLAAGRPTRGPSSAHTPGTQVRHLRIGAGDQHAGGRSVVAAELNDGRVFYGKPYSDPVGPLLLGLLTRLDQVGPPLGLRFPVAHARDGWVWTEEVRAAACQSPAEVADWYRRAGALLAVLTTVGASDCHHENLISCRHGPVLVDLETALSPASDEIDVVTETLSSSPVATSMVTSHVDGRPGQPSVDIGGLAAPMRRATPYLVTTAVPVQANGSPGTALAQAQVQMDSGTALPRLADHPVAIAQYAQQVCEGFNEVRQRLGRLGDPQVLLPDPDGQLEGAGVRYVVRATQVYARLLAAAGSAECLRDGVTRELVLERLWLAAGKVHPDLISAEQDSLRDLDVPRFVVPLAACDRIIAPDGRAIPHKFTASPLAHARARILHLAGDGYQRGETDLLSAIFAADPIPTDAALARSDTRQPAAALAPAVTQFQYCDPPPVNSAAMNRSDPISLIVDSALLGPDGWNWIGLEYDPSRLRWAVGRLGPSLTGVAGVALALVLAPAEAHRVRAPGPAGRTVTVQQMGRAALLSCADRIRSRPSWTCQDGITGAAGVVWALARAADHLGDDHLLAIALNLLPTALSAARAASADQIPCGFTLDPIAAATLAALALPADQTRGHALEELIGLLDAPLPAPRRLPRDAAAHWAASYPSAPVGRMLAQAVLGQTANSSEDAPVSSPLTWGDAIALAHCNRLSERDWAHLRDRACTSHDLLELASVANTAAAASPDPRWGTRAASTRRQLVAYRERYGSWFPGSNAPDSGNLSAIHGMSALSLLGIGDDGPIQATGCGPPAANVRILR